MAALLTASKAADRDINAVNIKHIFMSHQVNAGWNHSIKTATKSFENKANFEHLRVTVINTNTLIYSWLNSRNGYYYLAQELCLPVLCLKL